MPPRLPSTEDALAILKRRRTRPAFRPPPAAGRALNPLLKQLDQRFGSGPGALQARWREIVGDAIARRTAPNKLTRPRAGGPQTLELKVDGASAAIVQHQVPEILARVNLFLGAGAVGKVRIVQGPVAPLLARAAASRSRRTPAPMDAAEEARLQSAVESVSNDRLRSALLRFSRAAARGVR